MRNRPSAGPGRLRAPGAVARSRGRRLLFTPARPALRSLWLGSRGRSPGRARARRRASAARGRGHEDTRSSPRERAGGAGGAPEARGARAAVRSRHPRDLPASGAPRHRLPRGARGGVERRVSPEPAGRPPRLRPLPRAPGDSGAQRKPASARRLGSAREGRESRCRELSLLRRRPILRGQPNR